MRTIAAIAVAAVALVSGRPAYACVQAQITPNGIVYPELGPECPGPPVPAPDNRARAIADRDAREAAYGRAVKHLSDDQCYTVLSRVPGYVFPLDGPWEAGMPNRASSYLTPQENWCMALGRSHESPANNQLPGLLPEGARATPLGNGAWWIHR